MNAVEQLQHAKESFQRFLLDCENGDIEITSEEMRAYLTGYMNATKDRHGEEYERVMGEWIAKV